MGDLHFWHRLQLGFSATYHYLFPQLLWVVVSYATFVANPSSYRNLPHAPLAWLATLTFLGGLVVVFFGLERGEHLLAFMGSGAFILGILAATAAIVYSVMLNSTLDSAFDLTALNSSVVHLGLREGLTWWVIGFPAAIGYVIFQFRFPRGRVKAAAEGEGY